MLALGFRSWDLQRQERGLQGRRPFLPPLLWARGRILHCNFKCYNFLITSSQTMSSLCSEGPPPSLLPRAPHAAHRLQGFYGQGQRHHLEQRLRGPSTPQNHIGCPRGDIREGPSVLSRPWHIAQGSWLHPRAGLG